ncbi:MAG: alkaline phosphatase family protein [Bryobacteraceae bacterium]
MNSIQWSLAFGLAFVWAQGTNFAATPTKHKTQNVIFVMTDGLRWQEVFGGADSALMNKENGGVPDAESLKTAYWRDSPQARRMALMPFLWSVVSESGQIYGNRNIGSEAYVTNGFNFSYPGYSETLCGFANSRIHSNDKIPNPNVTVMEWLEKKASFKGKVAAFGAWDVFPSIFNADRAGFPVNAGYDPFTSIPMTPRLDLLNRFKTELPRVWADEAFDAIPFYTALEYLKFRKPKVLYLSLGETDDWAHQGNYAEYLTAAHRVDDFLRALWESIQSMPEYRGKTTLIFSPDHGRGEAPTEWKSHGEKIPDSKYIWIAFLGPDTPALGERSNISPVTQSQIAATLAAFLGEDYPTAVEKAGKPIFEALPRIESKH